MSPADLVVGLLKVEDGLHDAQLHDKLRDLTIAWLRFKYAGRILEDAGVDMILGRACEAGSRYCLILTPGDIATHAWKLGAVRAIRDWAAERRFLAAGDVLVDERGCLGLSPRRLLVDLERYAELGSPAFGEPMTSPTEVALPAEESALVCGSVSGEPLRPSGSRGLREPGLAGWNLLHTSLAHDLAVPRFPPELAQTFVSIQPENERQAAALRGLLGSGLAQRELDAETLSAGQLEFLRGVQRQVRNCQRGIFVWNFEDCRDVDEAPAGFEGPVSTLCSVAAGLKTSRILETHGFDEATALVYFDYSAEALEFKRLLHGEWDGEDYPRFLRYLFEKIPSKRAFYQLWGGYTPEELSWQTVEDAWRREVSRWGGEDVLREHWRRARELRIEYVRCNVLEDQGTLLRHVEDGRSAVIWWSNVFFTFFSNWHYTARERQAIYDAWIRKLAARAPRARVYGNDFNNVPVAGVSVQDYARAYFGAGASELESRTLGLGAE